jgi:hypothetical protein
MRLRKFLKSVQKEAPAAPNKSNEPTRKGVYRCNYERCGARFFRTGHEGPTMWLGPILSDGNSRDAIWRSWEDVTDFYGNCALVYEYAHLYQFYNLVDPGRRDRHW